MTKLGKLLSLVLMSCLLTTNALSATDSDLLKACDAALNAKVQEASLCGLGVSLRQNELERVTKENDELRSRGSSWLNNPFMWAAVGVIVGAYAGARATR